MRLKYNKLLPDFVFNFKLRHYFMGGVTRLTISLAVIIMEMSGEAHFLLPILIGITVGWCRLTPA